MPVAVCEVLAIDNVLCFFFFFNMSVVRSNGRWDALEGSLAIVALIGWLARNQTLASVLDFGPGCVVLCCAAF